MQIHSIITYNRSIESLKLDKNAHRDEATSIGPWFDLLMRIEDIWIYNNRMLQMLSNQKFHISRYHFG